MITDFDVALVMRRSGQNGKSVFTVAFIAIIIVGLGFSGALILAGVAGMFFAVFAPFVLSFYFLRKRFDSGRKAVLVLFLQSILFFFIFGMTIGKIHWTDNGMVIGMYVLAIVFTIVNYFGYRSSNKPYWEQRKYKGWSND